MSISKSVTSLGVGALLDDGLIESVHQPIQDFLPEWRGHKDGRAAITFRHLLSHTSGLPAEKILRNDCSSAAIAQMPLLRVPGSEFYYSSNGTDLLGLLIARATGECLEDYLQRRLLGPLSIQGTWVHPFAGGGLALRPTELARLGQLVVQGGVWDGAPLVSPAWITQSMRPSQPFVPSYGFSWWREAPGLFSARGWMGQQLLIAPAEQVVAVRMRHVSGASAPRYHHYPEFHSDVMAFTSALERRPLPHIQNLRASAQGGIPGYDGFD